MRKDSSKELAIAAPYELKPRTGSEMEIFLTELAIASPKELPRLVAQGPHP